MYVLYNIITTHVKHIKVKLTFYKIQNIECFRVNVTCLFLSYN